MERISILNFFIFLLGLLFISTRINAEPDVLKATVVEQNGNEIHLEWVQTKHFLANKYLPIWEIGENRSLEQNKQLARDPGRFVFYHDLKETSAIVYFKKSGLIFGSIKNNYGILGLPISKLDNKLKIGKCSYIHMRDALNATCSRHNSRGPSVTTDDPQFVQQPGCSNWQAGVSNPDKKCSYSQYKKHPLLGDNVSKLNGTHLGDFYPEILIIVNHDMLPFPYSSYTMYIDILTAMNEIALLFAKLKDHVNIYINIAAIIFEKTPDAFSQFENTEIRDQYVNEGQAFLLSTIHKYLNSNLNSNDEEISKIYSEDAFDFYFLILHNRLLPLILGEDVNGMSSEVFDIVKQRSILNKRKGLRKYMGIFTTPYSVKLDYPGVAGHVARLMRVKNDRGASHFIMRRDKTLHPCAESFEWSVESIASFRQFFREDTNRCFLMNEPRSLYKFDTPRKTLTPEQQCKCYNYGIDENIAESLENLHKDNACALKLPCIAEPANNTKVIFVTPFSLYPIDGTPCAKDKVCWRKKCVASYA